MDIYDKYDERLRNRWRDEDDEGRVARDGESIRVPMMLMDNKTVQDRPAPYQHADRRPREFPTTDAERDRRRALYDRYDARVSAAWKTPPVTEGE